MRVISWNVRGLGANKKLYKIRDRLGSLNPEILCIQETKLQSLDSFCFNKFTPPNLDQWSKIDAIGSSGGLLTYWDSRLFDYLSVLQGDFSLSISLKDRRSGSEWIITNVYSPCLSSSKKNFWIKLSQLGVSLSSSRWLIGGDFNCTVSSSDRNKPSPPSKISKSFLSFINKFNLLDIPLAGRKFTWSNLQANPSLVKLDRFLISSLGWDTFPQSHCSGHPRYLSDHTPLEFSSACGKEPRKPFKLDPSLLGHSHLDSLIRLVWASSYSLHFHLRMRKVKKQYKKFSRENFKSIHSEKSSLLAIIQDLDLQEESRGLLSPVSSLKRTQTKIQLAKILDSEELIWKLRSKAKWIKNGDRNTKYYHRMASFQKKLNFISRITISNSEFSSPALIHKAIRQHFQAQFSAPVISQSPQIDWVALPCPKLSPQQAETLEAPFTLVEIHKAIWAMPDDKTPGPDGFPIKFFKHFWESLKNDIHKIMIDFQAGELNLIPLNLSFLTLIPKCEGASELKEFRPISLQNSITKIISKILAECIKGVLEFLIAGCQSAYLKGRSVVESFAVAQEVIHSAKKIGLKGVLLKFDVSKAFDSLRWDFLIQSLQARGFGPRWVSWISSLLNSNRISVLLNGSPSKPFSIYRGLRQGDPLSAYLFILATDSLSRMITLAQSSNLISGFPLNPTSSTPLCLTHLQFVDDTVIFSSDLPSSIFMLKAIFYFFGLISSLSLNLEKTQLIELNLSDSESISLDNLFEYKQSTFPIKYLGLPLKDSRLLRTDWAPLSTKITSSMSSWKAQLLSISGRVILINSVLSALPIHYMTLFSLPSWLIQQLDKIRRNFLWSGQPSLPKKIHLVGWKEVYKSPVEGGLGIKNLRNFNTSLLLKWWWKLLFKPSLWSSVITNKYYQRRLPLDLNIKPSKSSSIWRSILKIGPIFKVSHSWTLSNGKSISFWTDKWGTSLSLKTEFPLLFACALEPKSKVSQNFNRRTLSWIPKFPLPLPFDSSIKLLNLMQLLSSFTLSTSEDSPKCSWSPSILSLKSSYDYLNLSGISWKFYDIWKLSAPPRIKLFLWLTLKGKINTKDTLLHRGILIPNPSCTFNPEPESIDHLFLNCPRICPLWVLICSPLSSDPIPLAFVDLWSSWRHSLSDLSIDVWDRRAPALMWATWIERNNRIFLNTPADIQSLLNSAQEAMSSWATCSS